MVKQIYIGLMTEGPTDIRFLGSIVQRTFESVGFECNCDVETILIPINIDKSGLSFTEQVVIASKYGLINFGITILCVHTDADSPTDVMAMNSKILPAQLALKENQALDVCKIMTAVVPVRMIEAWMLADIELLKREIGTTISNVNLGLHRQPEQIADPKKVIEEAIREARKTLSKRKRKDLAISDLYRPIGQKISIEKLESLSSFKKFKDSIRVAYRWLNYMQ